MNKILICIIRVYQNIAPKCIRNACRFTPTCSEYAILVLKKEKVTIAMSKILKRLARCKPPNEGFDFP